MKRFLLLFFAGAALAFAQVTIPWEDVDKSGSNLNQITTRNFADLQSKPTSAAGYGIANGAVIDAWGTVTNSAALAGRLSDETGTGAAVFANAPSLITPSLGAATAQSVDFTSSGQAGARITLRQAGNMLEWGHANQSGYGSTLGANSSNGRPFIAFNAEAGTTGNTFRTRGFVGRILQADLAGGLIIGRATSASADNQSLAPDVTIGNESLNVGNMQITPNGFYAGGGAAGQGRFFYSAVNGASLQGQTGSQFDLALAGAGGSWALAIPTGTTHIEVGSDLRVTATAGAKFILIGNQNSSGADTPALIRGVNGTLQIGRGSSWTAAGGGTMTTVISTDLSNRTTLTGDLTMNGTGATTLGAAGATVAIAGTSAVKGVRTATANLAFGTIAAGSGTTLTVTVTGVAQGDTVIVDRTDGGNWGDSVMLGKWATANTVHVRLYNYSGSGLTVGTPSVRVTAISF